MLRKSLRWIGLLQDWLVAQVLNYKDTHMTPIDHARLSARDFGGSPEDYLPLHSFLDSTKFHCEDSRHRAILHNTFGVGLCEQLFGVTIGNSDGNHIPTRELARRHIREDCGLVPSLKETLDALTTNTYSKYDRPSATALGWLKKTYYARPS